MRTQVLAVALSFTAGVSAFGSKFVANLATSSNASTAALPPSQDPWYSAPPGFATAAPGTILKLRTAAPEILTTQTNSSAAYNILYRTTDSQYHPTWAVTTLLVPISPDPTKLLSYQIAYDSADVDSSPSYSLLTSIEDDISAALGRGWFVSSPDYEGPLASFTAGVMSGHATLDSIRAILSSGLGLNTTNVKYAMWGYSGGALASEWGAELAVQYAPELSFAGAALGGLTPNVTSVMDTVEGTLYAGLIPPGILGLASQYPALAALLNASLLQSGPYNATGFYASKNYSLDSDILAYLDENITDYFTDGTALIQSATAQLVIHRDGIMGYHGVPQMPIFAYKAIGDNISPIADTDILVERYCGIGATINYQRNTIGNHVTEESNGDARAVSFLISVLGGTYNATGCQISNVTVEAGNTTTTAKKMKARSVYL